MNSTIPPPTQLSRRVSMTLEPAERRALDDAARRRSLPVSTYCRMVLLGAIHDAPTRTKVSA